MVAGEGGAAAHFEAGDIAALLVDGDDQFPAFGAQPVGECGELFRTVDIAAEEADRDQALAEPAQQPVGRGGAGEAGLEDGEGIAGEGVGGAYGAYEEAS